MTDEEKERPWWKKRRTYGAILTGIGGLFIMTPGAPVAVVIGTLPVTWPMIGVAASWIGTNVFAWGLGKAQERNHKE